MYKPYHPHTNKIVERFNRRVDDNILNIFTFENYRELESIIYQYGYTYNKFTKQKQLDNQSSSEYIRNKYIEDFELKSFNDYNQKRDNMQQKLMT